FARQVRYGDAVVGGPLGPHGLVRRRDDDVGLVERRVDRLAVYRQVLARLDEFVLVAVELQASALGKPGPPVVGLLETDRLRIGAAHDQRRNAVLGLLLEIEEIVALGA